MVPSTHAHIHIFLQVLILLSTDHIMGWFSDDHQDNYNEFVRLIQLSMPNSEP